MNRMVKWVAVIAVGALILGCEGPKIKQAVDALTPQVSELESQAAGIGTALGKVNDLINKVAGGKIEKAAIDTAMLDADKVKGELTAYLGLEGQLGTINDSLAVLDKKASGDNKKAVAGLKEKINGIAASINEAKNGCGLMDQLKVKLEEMKKPAKPEKGKKGTVKKAAAPTKK